MANSYKNLIIIPNRSSSSDDPKITFSGANTTANTDITLRMYPTSNGTLSFEGSAGQLFSITNDLTGTIYSVNDVSGIPSIAVYANGQIDMARYSGNTFIGSGNTSVVSLNGTANVFFGARTGNLNVGVGTYFNTITPIGDTNMNLSTPSGAVYFDTSIRGPIFYDYNNTSYYVDPASTSNLLASYINTHLYTSYNSYNPAIRVASSGGAAGLLLQESGGSFRVQLYGDGTNYGFLDGAWASWDIKKTIDGNMYMNGNDSYYLRTDSDSYMYRVYGAADIRSPIFYDNNDTGYYINPNSSSSVYGISIRGDSSSADISNQIFFWGSGAGTTSAIGFKSNYSPFSSPTGNGDGYNTYFSMDTDGRGWVFRRAVGGTDFSAAYTSGWILNNGIWQANASMRSPIFYDSDDTGYYGNFAGTSSFNRIAVVRSGNNVYTDADYGYGLVGAYSASRYQGVYAMGDSYKLPADGTTTGSLYGMAWSHPNAGGAAGNLNSHGLLLLQNGGFMAALSTNGTFSADVRGTIFYDYSNTGYYVDPNGGTSINVAGAILAGGNITAYYSDERLKTKLGPIENAIDKVKTLDGFYYQANEVAQKLGYKVKRELGLSAQQVQAILPEIVAPAPIDNRYLTIHYERVVPLLVEAIKELNHKHETEIAELKQALAALLNKQ